jgi:hypothetical protein
VQGLRGPTGPSGTPGGTAQTVTASTTSPTSPAKNTQVTAIATCPLGTTRTGGGAELSGQSVFDLVVTVMISEPLGANAWRVVAINEFGGNAPAYTVTANAVCVG